MRFDSQTVPNGAAAPDSACRCASCGIPTSQHLCVKCAAYCDVGLAAARLSRVMHTLELFGADDPIPALPVRVCDLAEVEDGL